MSSDYKFQGWLGLDKDSVKGKMVWQDFEPKKWEETDVDIKITHCGICGSDLHTLRSGWGQSLYPVCVGHEIVGTAVRVGSKAHGGIKVGDRVGVGAQSSSCLKPDCAECSDGHEQYCQKGMAPTYNGKYPSGDKTMGGYADYWRGPSHFVIKIPDSIPSDAAGPMLCGGITAFQPLVHQKVGPGKTVGIVGVGGLGHFGIMGAKALGADKVVAISRSDSKKSDALKMGATDFIATQDAGWANKHAKTLDVIVCTVSSPNMPLEDYLKLLKVRGSFVQVGAPEDKIPSFMAFSLLTKGISIEGSAIGSPQDIRDMLDLFATKGVKTWNNNYPMEKANQAVIDFEDGKPRYRFVLVNEKHAMEEGTL